MKLRIKNFKDLSLYELYDILKLRTDVFVVDQACPYPELDDKDQEAIHLWLEEDGRIQIYCRILKDPKGKEVYIGRVVTRLEGRGLGKRIMEEAIRYIIENLACENISLEAQTYAIGFYEKCGFEVVSQPFDMDGIDHVKMTMETGA